MVTVSLDKAEKEKMRAKAGKPLLWVGMVSMIMLFAGLTSAYIVREAEGNWWVFPLPKAFYISTVVIILSSISLGWALYSAKRNNTKAVKTGLLLTLLLGIGFVFLQFAGYATLVEGGVFFAGAKSNAAGSFLYAITGLHLAHLLAGIVVLIVTFVNSWKEKYNAQNLLGLQLTGTFWHFLGGLWIYLFLFLLLVR